MRKRLIALTLTLALLISVSPTVFADDTSARPTVEEILSDYHQAAFEAETSGEASASTYSRSGSSGQTLEQQTVDTLNEAGYEAYNVTADNYDTLEEQLQTDFFEMGLDPDGSYIVVIHGEEENSTNGNARLGDLILPPHLRDDGYGSNEGAFTYTYNGTSYTMRYITVTSDDDGALLKTVGYSLDEDSLSSNYGNFFGTFITWGVDYLAKVPIATIASVFYDQLAPDNSNIWEYRNLHGVASSAWTLQYIQIYNSASAQWVNAQCSEFAISTITPIMAVYDVESETLDHITGESLSFKTYSPHYENTSKRKEYAVEAYLDGVTMLDYTEDIALYVTDSTGTINCCTDGNYIGLQLHWTFCE